MDAKTKILNAALRVFAETGYRGATTRRIAQEADVNEVTLFRHYGSKDDLIRAAVQYAALEEAHPVLPSQPVDPERELVTWARAHHDRMHARRAIIRTCLAESSEHPEMAKCVSEGPRRVAQELKSYLQRLRSSGRIDQEANLDVATTVLTSSLYVDAMNRELTPELFPFEAERAPVEYVRLVLRSLGLQQKPNGKKRTLKKLIFVLGLSVPALSMAQQPGRSLSLQDAVRMASEVSEDVTIARAGIQRARGEQYRARSEYYPQLSGSLSYTRTLKTEFSALSEESDSTTTQSESCADFNPNRLLPLAERVDSLEAALKCRDSENPFGDLFTNLPFGRANQWNFGLSASQTVFSGGRVQSQNRIAEAGHRSAEINLASANAQLVLSITQAYYDAALSDQLLAIAEATMKQAETTLAQVKVARQVGDQPEFELLRAQVTHDNQRPIVIQRRADRDQNHIRLKQLLNLPLDESLALTTRLNDDVLPVVTVSAVQSDTSSQMRAPVRQAEQAVGVQEALATIARSQRLPNVTLSSQYGRVAYPGGGLPELNSFRSNWTVTAALQVPIFTGGRLRGNAMVAEANLVEARARLQQTRELAALDTRNAVDRLRSAEAAWQASAGTVEQAARAYSIAEIRYKEGISTQLELNDSRILLQQAEANRAVAARDLQVARARLALLPDLPLAGGVGSGAGGATMIVQPQTTPALQTPPGTQAVRGGN